MLYVTGWKRNTRVKLYRIEITDLAAEDLENAVDYIAYQLKNPLAAVNTVEGIRQQINSLGDFSERNELDEDEKLAELGIRNEYYKNYKIYYVVNSDVVYIVRILHMRVDSRTWLYRTFGL